MTQGTVRFADPLAVRPQKWATRHRLVLVLALLLGGMVAGCTGRDMVGPTFNGQFHTNIDKPIVLAVGDTQRIVVTATRNGRVVNVEWIWSSSEPRVATVNSTGLVTGRSAGKTSVSATVKGYGNSVGTSVAVQ